MIDTKELRRLAQAVSGWSNCNHAWLDTSEDVAAAVVGHIDESGETHPVATIDCDQYFAAHQSLPLAKFYAAANPAAISELLDSLEAAEKSRDDLLACLGEWLDKTKWVQRGINEGTISPKYLGLHRADVIASLLGAAEKERDALRAKITEMEKQEPASLVTPTAYRWRYRGAVKWQYGELTEETVRLARAHSHEVQPLYALPGAKGESE